MRSIFARGHYFEAESRQQLRRAGFVFAPHEVLGFVAADGLIAGHADGIIISVPDDVELCSTPALWEHKALNAKNYRAVERDGLAKVFPRYAAQVALYQNFLEVTNPALMTIVNADTCERLHFTVPFDAAPGAGGQRSRGRRDRGDARRRIAAAASIRNCEDFRCKMCSSPRKVPAP